MLDAAIRALPDLLAQRLALLWPEDADLRIETPLRLSIPISLSELATRARDRPQNYGGSPGLSFGALERRVERALEQTLSSARLLPDDHDANGDHSISKTWPELIAEPRLTAAASLIELWAPG